ncbi:MAG TPA: helix-turn-helix domain-containing protein [Acidobacteriaceae bacterium]|nr:helix-turn-helix domain-containing protein [Acidobacteriaceae bacterium]
MSTKKRTSPKMVRKPRADAERNRQRILEAAREAFTRDGAAASLDDIARRARIGPGTLYRHFPTRDALIEAVYRHEVEKLAAAAPRFSATMRPLDALRAWMLLFVEHVAKKMLIVPVMETVEGGSSRLVMSSRGLIRDAFTLLANEAVASGDLRRDTDADVLLRALVGVFHTAHEPGWEEVARRVVDILIAGSRNQKETRPGSEERRRPRR